MKKIIIFLSILIILWGCIEIIPNYEELSLENSKYVGNWIHQENTNGISIEIRESGSGDISEYYFGANSNISGGKVELLDGNLSISLWGIEKEFIINKEPYEEDGQTLMILNDKIFIKKQIK